MEASTPAHVAALVLDPTNFIIEEGKLNACMEAQALYSIMISDEGMEWQLISVFQVAPGTPVNHFGISITFCPHAIAHMQVSSAHPMAS